MRYCLLDCEDAEKWKGHEQCYTGALPPLDTLRDYDAVFITGSHYSVYERRAWISQLKAYLRLAILGRRMPVKFIGICFGCQVLADALGGRVGPNPEGGFVCKVEEVTMDNAGLQRCGLTDPEAPVRILQSHGDQVLQLPPDALHLGSSLTAPHELWAIEGRVLAIQGHPELNKDDVIQKILPAVRGRMDDAQTAASSVSLRHATPTPDIVWQLVRAFVHCRQPLATTTAQPGNAPGQQPDNAPSQPDATEQQPSTVPSSALFWKALPTFLDTSFFATTAAPPAAGSLTAATDATADVAYHLHKALAAEGSLATTQYQALTACNVAIARRFRSMEAYATGMAAFVDGVGQRLDSVERMHAAAQQVDRGLRGLEARVEALRVLVDALGDAVDTCC